jgi:hypothetical protein
VFLLSPKSCSDPWSESGDRELDLEELTRVLFIPSCPGYIVLTGALDRSDQCEPFVGFSSGELLNPCVIGCDGAGQFLAVSEVFWLALCRVLLPCRLCFKGVFVPGPREVTEALWNICCAAAVATGLTGSVHRSDRCHQSDRHRPSV